MACNKCDFNDALAIQQGFRFMWNIWRSNHMQARVSHIASVCTVFVIAYTKHAIDFNADCLCPEEYYFNIRWHWNTRMLDIVLQYNVTNWSSRNLKPCWCIKSSLNMIRGGGRSVPQAFICARQQHPRLPIPAKSTQSFQQAAAMACW